MKNILSYVFLIVVIFAILTLSIKMKLEIRIQFWIIREFLKEDVLAVLFCC